MRRLFIVFLLAGVVCAAVGVWRLRRGPISIDFLLPRVEQLVNPRNSDFRIDIANAAIKWGSWRHPVGLGLRRVRVHRASGDLVAELPAVTLGLSGRALLNGVVAPRWIEVSGAELRFEREPGGRVRSAPSAGAKTGDDTLLVDLLVQELASLDGTSGHLRFLNGVRIVDARVQVTDAQSGRVLEGSVGGAELLRDHRGVSGTLEAEARLGRTKAQLAATFLYAREDRTAHAALSVAGVDVGAAAFLFPVELQTGVEIDLVLEGSANVRVGVVDGLRQGTFDLRAGNSAIRVPSLWPQKLALQGLRVTGGLQGESLSIDSAVLDLRGAGARTTTVRVNGSALLREGVSRVGAEARIEHLDVEALQHYWPKDMAASARRWVADNIHAGSVKNVVVAAAVERARERGDSPQLADLQGAFEYEALEVTAASALPRARRLSGRATFGADAMRFEIKDGTLGDLDVERGSVVIRGMGSGSGRVDVAVRAVGSSLAILDVASPGVVDALGLQRRESVESGAIEGSFEIPLGRTRSFDDVGADVTARLPGLVVDTPLMTGRGQADVHLLGEGDGPRVVETHVTLTQSRLRLPGLGDYEAAPGVEGHGRATLHLEDGRPLALTSFEIDSGPVRARGVAAFGQQPGQLKSVDLQELHADGTSLSGVHVRFDLDAVRVDVDAGVVNAASFTADGSTNEVGGEGSAPMPFSLTAPRLQRVSFADERFVEDVCVVLVRDGRGWKQVALEGRVPESLRSRVAAGAKKRGSSTVAGVYPVDEGDFEINWRREGEVGRMRANVHDTGGLLRALNFEDAVQGGALQASGTSSSPAALEAYVRAGPFSVTSKSLLFRLLNLASGRGILDRPSGDHISFDELTGNVLLSQEEIRFSDVTARGAVVAVTMAGAVAVESGTMELGGEIVPAYELTRMLTSVPLLGAIRIGDQGLVAVVYSAKGPVRDPSLSVHPVSSLTPSLLRRLLGALPGQGKPSPGSGE